MRQGRWLVLVLLGGGAAGLCGGCADDGPSAQERQDRALRDPFNYGPVAQPTQQPVRGAREPRGPIDPEPADRRE